MVTRRLARDIASALHQLPIGCRVKAFNELVLVFKRDNEKFSVSDFFDYTFRGETNVGYGNYQAFFSGTDTSRV